MSKLVKLVKLDHAPNDKHKNLIPVGVEKIGEYVSPPEVGKHFYVGGKFKTSAVVEIISEHVFRTYNSIYKWEIV
jgi:hypothetical protein